LEKICADDKESYEALRESMFLDPRKLDVPMKDSVEKAKSFEKQGKKVEARIWYEVAGGLAIYEGDVEQVKKYFSKCKELSPNSAYPATRTDMPILRFFAAHPSVVPAVSTHLQAPLCMHVH